MRARANALIRKNRELTAAADAAGKEAAAVKEELAGAKEALAAREVEVSPPAPSLPHTRLQRHVLYILPLLVSLVKMDAAIISSSGGWGWGWAVLAVGK